MSAQLQIQRPARALTYRGVPACVALATRHLGTLTVALAAAVLLCLGRAAHADVALTVNVAPPPLPVYEQPPLPDPGYIWVPGYWSYGPEGYFWVPGTWVLPPDPDLVWTPGWWGFADNAYVWHAGYWGPEVGFYGGIVYGFGYNGQGYDGGYWRDHKFYYNRAVNNVSNTNVTTVYNKTVVNNTTVNNVSYNGGPGGVNARPTAQQEAAARQPRHAATSEQTAQVSGARNQHELLASVNQGHPAVAATPKPNTFSGPGVVPARAAAQAGHAQPPPSAGRQGAEPTHSEPSRRLAQAPPPPPEHRAPAEHPAPPAPAERAAPSERPPQERPPAAHSQERAPAERPPQERAPPERSNAQEHPPAEKSPPKHEEPNHRPNEPGEPRG